MRARWLALGLLLGMATLASGQGGVGLFFSPACTTVANPVAGSTLCWQTASPNQLLYWNGSAWLGAPIGDPYSPTSFTVNGVLYGNGAGGILTTAEGAANSVLGVIGGVPTFTSNVFVTSIDTAAQFAVGLEPFGTAPGNTGGLYFRELAANGTDYIVLRAPDSVDSPIEFKLPNTTGTNGFALITDGGNPATLSWASIGGGGGTGLTSLNTLTAAVQTFVNDTNVTITSSVAAHTLGWSGTLSVDRGGSGAATFTANGVLLGNTTSAFQVTAAGAADTVLRVPGAGGTPAFGALDVSKAAAITGLVRTANLGSGSPDATTFLRGDQTWAPPTSAIAPTNYLVNSNFESWGAGVAAAPTSWSTSSCSTVAKNTTAGQFKIGTASLALTRSSGSCIASQNVAVAYPPTSYWQSQVGVVGGWVRCTVADRGFLELFDGTTTTTSAAHSGGSAYEFLSVPASLGSGATTVEVRAKVAGGSTTCQFDGLVFSRASAISSWVPDAYQGRKAIMVLTSAETALSAIGTTFFGSTGNNTEGPSEVLTPFKGVARNLGCRISSSIASGSYVLTLRTNEADTALTGTITTIQATDSTHEVEIAKFDRVAIKSVASAPSPSGTKAICQLEYEEVP